ncbi:TPA: hypothetical protein NJZ13_003543 [Vibrio parahaemolyticus]|nr:hypothetical protein [Vibrio parahaemolyticus]
MKFSGKLAVAGIVISALGIVISTVLSLAALSQSRSIAVESGSLKKADIHVFLGQAELLPNRRQQIVFGVKKDEVESGLVIAPYTIGIENAGDDKLENTYITFRYNKILDREHLEYLEFKAVGAIVDGAFSRKFSSAGAADYVTYNIPVINPSVTLGIDEPFILYETEVVESVEVEGHATVTYRVAYSINVKVSVSSSSSELQDYDLDISAISSQNLDELQDKYEAEVQSEIDNLRSALSFIDYLSVLLFDNDMKSTVLIYPHNRLYRGDSYSIYYPDVDQIDYRTVWYRPARWRNLFN